MGGANTAGPRGATVGSRITAGVATVFSAGPGTGGRGP